MDNEALLCRFFMSFRAIQSVLTLAWPLDRDFAAMRVGFETTEAAFGLNYLV